MMTKMSILSDPQRILDISNVVYIGSAFLAVIATFLIVMFGNRVARLKEIELKAYQTAADARIAEAHTASDASNTRAAQANKEAEIGKVAAAQAMENASSANQKAEEARLKAAIAEESAQRATVAAEQERIVRIQLQQNLASLEGNLQQRDVTDQQTDVIVSYLKDFIVNHPNELTKVPVVMQSRDYDTVQYSHKIAIALTKAGLQASIMPDIGWVGSGLGVLISSKTGDAPELAEAVYLALKKSGMPVVFGRQSLNPAYPFYVLVGARRFPDNNPRSIAP